MQQNILERYPSAKLQVYAVWLPMLPTDARSAWDRSLLSDSRVTHFWDGSMLAGEWFAEERHTDLDYPGAVVWDAYALFGPDARWERAPSDLVGAGWTVIGTVERLKADLEPFLDGP